MFPASNKPWQPSAHLSVLAKRAQLLKAVRTFFDKRDVMEVDTPLLCDGVATDPHLHTFCVAYEENQQIKQRFLQTSPEFAMKRLLAAGCGPIYYLGKAFRFAEIGHQHNPEFTMLEWYRPGWTQSQLMDEVDALLQATLATPNASIKTYQALFEEKWGCQPHLASCAELAAIATAQGWAPTDPDKLDKDDWLNLLMSYGIEPTLGQDKPIIVTDFPASQAALAKIRTIPGTPPFAVAARFEFYYQGVELANGYDELVCATEQRARFETDLQKRRELKLPQLPIDEALLSALATGMPNCAGVALGFDRLLMLQLKQDNIANVLPFAWQHA